MDSIKFFNDKNLLNSSTNAKSNSKNNNIDTIKTSETVNIDKYKNKVNEVLNFATTSLESVPNKQEERKWYDFGGHIQDAFQTAAGTISNGVNCIWNNLQSAYNNSINAIGEQFSKTQVFKIVDKTIGWDIPKKVLSSVGNASVAVTKGIENVVEGTLDILQLTGGAILTPITGIVDGIIYATGNDLGLTNYLWNKQIRPSVEYKIMDNITDAYYKGHGKIMNDNAFELLKNNSVGFNIFEQIGGVLGTLAGGQLLSSSGIFGSTAGITSKAFVRASTAIAGASGVGQGTEDAWNDGADIEKGLIYGVSRGIVDGLQYWLGGKINSIVLGKGTSLVSKIGGASVRVVLDGVDGAVEVPVEAALKSIYNDKTWNENFDEAGGWNGVAQQFLLGSGFSFASEIGGPIIKKGILKKEIKKMNNNQLLLFIKQSIDENNFNDIIKQIDANRLSEIFENMDNITMKKVISSMDNKTFDKLYKNLSDDLKNIISLNNYRPSNSKFHSSVIESAISTIDDELGFGSDVKKLKESVENGDFSQITENGYVKKNLQGVQLDDIKKVNIVDDLGLEFNKVDNQTLTYNNLFNKNTTGVSVDEMVEKLKDNGLLQKYNEKIDDISILYSRGEGPNVIHHDVNHVERVMLYSMYMGEELGLNSNEMNVLIDAAKYHDVGVYNGHKGHSLLSAQAALENLNGSYSKENLNKIAAIIEYHGLTDSVDKFDSLIKKYNISSNDAEEVLKIANILKDADALDRTRFMRNLDTKYFRNSELANNLVMASYQMQEIQAKQILDQKITNGVYNNKQIRDIKSYRKNGIPDYVIYESYENYYKWGYVSAENMIDVWTEGLTLKKGTLKNEIKKMNNAQLLLFVKQNIDENNFNDIIKQIDVNKLGEIIQNMDDTTMKKVISSIDDKTFNKLYNNSNDDLKKIISLNNYRSSNSKFHSSVIESAISTIDDELGSSEGIKKLKQFENAKKYNSDYDIAIEYGDRTQYMYLRLKELIENTGNQQLIDYYEKIKNLPNYEKNSEEIFKTIKPFMNKDERLALSKFNVFNLFSNSDYKDLHKLDNMFGYQSIFNQNEKSEMKIYSRISGPIIAGYNRGIDEQFITRRGQSQLYRLSEAQKNYELCRLSCSEYGKKNISDAVSCIDEVIEKATPLAQDTILYRGANSIFNDGQLIDINNIKVGQIISDKAHVSTSLLKDKCYLNNNIVLEIMAPKGTKCAYLESFTYGYGQQEVLLPRNSKFRVISEPEPVDFNGKDQMVIKVEII